MTYPPEGFEEAPGGGLRPIEANDRAPDLVVVEVEFDEDAPTVEEVEAIGPEPTPDTPVRPLADIFGDVELFFRRFLVLPDEAFGVLAVWIAHCLTFEAAEFTAYVSVTSAAPRCGKSRLLEVIQVLLGNTGAISTTDISPASLFRLIDANPGTAVLVDEVDKMNKEKADDIWRLINSGWRLGGQTHRQGGKNFTELQSFSTFSPKVFAGIGQPLPETVMDRSLKIKMQRKLPGESVERLRLRSASSEVAPLHDEIVAWSRTEGVIEQLRMARPEFPAALKSDRMMDAAEPLFALADLAGGQWPTRVRESVVTLEGSAANTADEDLSILALRHVHETLIETDQKVFTDDLVHYLAKRDDGPWGGWWAEDLDRNHPQGPKNRLARMLKQFDIHPKQIRIGDDSKRGYELHPQVSQAAARYITPLGTETGETTATPLASTVADVSDVSVPDEVSDAICSECNWSKLGEHHFGCSQYRGDW